MTVPRNSAKSPRPPAIAAPEPLGHLRDLDLMIRLGWGDIPQPHLPNDWRNRPGPGKYFGSRPREVTKVALDHTVNR